MLKVSFTTKSGFQSQTNVDATKSTVMTPQGESKNYPRTINFHEGLMLTVDSFEDAAAIVEGLGFVVNSKSESVI